MIPELGQYALILALCISALLAIVPLVGSCNGNPLWMEYARPLSTAMFAFLLVSMICLGYAFVADDFSVAYVATNSNSALPIYYKISAVWGGHEGSLLLWVLILGGWTWIVAIKSHNLPLDMVARVLAVMGMISCGFMSFTLFTSNPFARYLPNSPQEGGDLNPLLQDIGLILHPPMLYMGYVGFSVAFAFAIAALLSGRLDAAWARWSRPWTLVAWAFLTLGIVLGSWWAYYELGWGGWWFWDPVENASLMPWLVGTALVHSLAVTEKRGVFKSWTVLLAIFTFSLSLMGTFLVRSGVLTSVHAFATDPGRGYFVLVLLAITIGGSLLLYAIKAAHVKSESSFGLISRETFLLSNNILLVVAAMMVLLGTLYPLLVDAMGMGKISVGPPYFNSLFIPLMAIMVVMFGFGIVARWRRTKPAYLIKQLTLPLLISLLVGGLFPLLYGGNQLWLVSLGMILAIWILLVSLQNFNHRILHIGSLLSGIRRLPRSYYGMQMAHLGVAVSLVGITLVSIYTEEHDLRMAPGEKLDFKEYSFVFDGTRPIKGANYRAEQARLRVFKEGKLYGALYPEKRFYNARGNVMTEAAIDPGFTRDLYVALGESLSDGAWAVRIQYKPFVRWLWLGGLLMTIGGILSAIDPRYRRKLKQQKE